MGNVFLGLEGGLKRAEPKKNMKYNAIYRIMNHIG
jgi:hypothetical protein